MRYFLALALVAFLAVTGWGLLHSPSLAQNDYVNYLWQVHRHETPIPSGMLAQSSANVSVEGQMVTYGNLDGQPIQGYLARPIDRNRPLPGLIVIHEWWGLNDNIKQMTQKLAAEGYTALAVDLYEGKTANLAEQARELINTALKNPDRLEANIQAAYDYLEQQKSPKIGSIGWCFGGMWSLNAALLFPDKLDAAVIYYGGQLETNPERLKTLQMPILGIFGERDRNPSVETVRQFESTLKSLDKTVEIYIYPDADHAFANPSGERYNPQAAADAWQKTQQFLARYLN